MTVYNKSINHVHGKITYTQVCGLGMKHYQSTFGNHMYNTISVNIEVDCLRIAEDKLVDFKIKIW